MSEMTDDVDRNVDIGRGAGDWCSAAAVGLPPGRSFALTSWPEGSPRVPPAASGLARVHSNSGATRRCEKVVTCVQHFESFGTHGLCAPSPVSGLPMVFGAVISGGGPDYSSVYIQSRKR